MNKGRNEILDDLAPANLRIHFYDMGRCHYDPSPVFTILNKCSNLYFRKEAEFYKRWEELIIIAKSVLQEEKDV